MGGGQHSRGAFLLPLALTLGACTGNVEPGYGQLYDPMEGGGNVRGSASPRMPTTQPDNQPGAPMNGAPMNGAPMNGAPMAGESAPPGAPPRPAQQPNATPQAMAPMGMPRPATNDGIGADGGTAMADAGQANTGLDGSTETPPTDTGPAPGQSDAGPEPDQPGPPTFVVVGDGGWFATSNDRGRTFETRAFSNTRGDLTHSPWSAFGGSVGYVAGRAGWCSAFALSGLSQFVFNFAVPALLFRSLATRGVQATSGLPLLLAYDAPALVVFMLGLPA